jgi:hypothetical protein
VSTQSAFETVRRFRDILSLVSRTQVRTAYEISATLKLPVSSTYLAVAELERLSCLARDESGYLLVGMRPQQMALDALGFPVAAQRLPPLVRYLRDQTGETVFMGKLSAGGVTVGPVAVGFNPGCLTVQPFQTFGLAAASPRTSEEAVMRLELAGPDLQAVEFLGVALARSVAQESQDLLVVGTARAGRLPDAAQIARTLLESRVLFHASLA